jgi:hypothetical protein
MVAAVASDPTIDDVLADLGYRTDELRHHARAALEAAGLTNGRKQRICSSKVEAAQQMLAAQLRLVCTRSECRTLAASSSQIVLDAARPIDCRVCGGSPNRAEVGRAVAALAGHRIHRVVIVGGSPATHEELHDLVDGRLDLRLVSGTDRHTARDAKADLLWADIVVVWGGTELHHKVSKLYTDNRLDHVVTCVRRGVSAMATTLSQTAESGRRSRR